MITKSCVLKLITEKRDEYRTDTDSGLKCCNSIDLVLKFVERLPKHDDRDLLEGESLDSWENMLSEAQKEISKRYSKKLNRVHTVSYFLGSEFQKVYYLKKQKDVAPFIKSLIVKEPLESIGIATYETNVKNIIDTEYLKLSFEEL